MKKIIKITIISTLFLLIIINIFIFTKGMILSEAINNFELKTNKLKEENMDLEAELYKTNSLKNTAKIANKLEFTKKADPYFLDNLKVALKK